MSGDDGIKRVTGISHQLNRIFSTIPIASMLPFNMLGLLLGAHIQTKVMSDMFTYAHSNMAFFGEPIKIFGITLERIVVASGLLRGSNPLFILTTSYNGKLFLQLVGNKAVFPNEESLLRLAKYVENEIKELDRQCYTEVSDLVATMV